MPQNLALNKYHKHYPDATFVLATRNSADWVDTTKSSDFRAALGACNLTECPAECVDDDKQLAEFYEQHTTMVRRWVQEHPSHQLIEINIDAPGAAAKDLAAATGFNASCWGGNSCRGSSCEFWLDVRIRNLQRANNAAQAKHAAAVQAQEDANCKNEECAAEQRKIVEKAQQEAERAAESLRQAEDERAVNEAAKKLADEEKEREKEREKEADAARERALTDNNKPGSQEALTPANNHDPNVVCVSFNEEVTEDWCYAACLGGICPPDAATDCMCSKGAEKPEQQSSGSAGKDWATGMDLPQGAVAATPSTDPTCKAIKAGYSDFWCQTSCGAAGTTACPEDLCSCEAGGNKNGRVV